MRTPMCFVIPCGIGAMIAGDGRSKPPREDKKTSLPIHDFYAFGDLTPGRYSRPTGQAKEPTFHPPCSPQDGSTESANCGRTICCYIWRKRCLSQFQQSVCSYFCSYSSRHIPFFVLGKPRHLTWCRRGRTQTSAVALPSPRSTERPSAGTTCAPLLSPELGSLRMPMM